MDTLYIQKEVLTLFLSQMLSHCFYYTFYWYKEHNENDLKKIRLKTTTYKIVEKKSCNLCWGMSLIVHRKRITFKRVANKP